MQKLSLNADSNREQNTFDEGFKLFCGASSQKVKMLFINNLHIILDAVSFSLSPGIRHCGLFYQVLASGILIKAG